MTHRVAIVTGGLRGLGRGMALGLAATGIKVLAVGHLPEDVAAMTGTPNVQPMIADLRSPQACDNVIAEAIDAFGRIDMLVNSAGLTFTYIDPKRFVDGPRKFWEISDEVIQNVMDTNYIAADQMGRRVAPILLRQGWGRIINVTTKLDTMNRAGGWCGTSAGASGRTLRAGYLFPAFGRSCGHCVTLLPLPAG
jgi:NAD(P)-dependent dehydrogenase (short-subunit alcohol dehydrogenase family)